MTQRYGGKRAFCERDEWGWVEVVQHPDGYALHFGSEVEQSRSYHHAPFTLAHEYQEQLFECILEWAEQPPDSRLLMLGLGAGSLVRQLLTALPQTQVTAIELRPAVIQVAHQYFDLPQSEQLTCLAQDAAVFIAQNRQPFNVIVMDLYDEHGLPLEFTTETFQQQLLDTLSAPALLLMNLWQTTPKTTLPILRFWEAQARQNPRLQLKQHRIYTSHNLILEIQMSP